MKKRIVLLLDSSVYGGIESHIFHLANLIKYQGLEPLIIFIKDHGNHPLQQMLEKSNIQYKKLDGSFAQLKQCIAEQPESSIFHAHGYKASILTRLFCILSGKRSISTFHCGDRGKLPTALYCWFDRVTSLLSHNIGVSEEIAKWHGGKIRVIKNFISPIKRPEKASKKRKIVAFVGRLSHEKGPDLFNRLAEHYASDTNIEFHVYGDGPMLEILKATAAANTVFHGFCDNMSRHWQHIDALFITSRHEGMPMVAIEAMMHNVSVLANPCGELPAMLGHGERGFLSEDASYERLPFVLETWLKTPDHVLDATKKAAHRYVTEHCSGKQQWEIYRMLYQS